MSEVAERFRTVAAAFSARAATVSDLDWDDPSPCDGWLARDIVRHMVAWMPALVALTGAAGSVLNNGHFAPSVDVPGTADAQTKLLALTGRSS
jgi:hypothetical protein